MKPAFPVGIILLLFSWGTAIGGGETRIGSYPLPLAESEALVTRWLQREKYAVTSNLFANGHIVLLGAAAGKQIRLSIRSHSPLTTEIELQEATGKHDPVTVRASWESFLAKAGQAGAIAVPEDIRVLADAVVCISAPSADTNKMNFSGFLIDQGGTILTIAHDIDDLRDFKLRYPGGGVGEGRVVKRDAAKDLSVIESDHRGYRKYFPLKEGRSRLKFGERIFMLCCNSNGNVQIQSGTVDRPKATVGSQTLWQVKLEQVFLGSSGSPVVDENGRLVGVVKGRFRGTDSRGFLIPVDTVRSFMGMGKK